MPSNVRSRYVVENGEGEGEKMWARGLAQRRS